MSELTASAPADVRAFFLPPAWLGFDDGEHLEIVTCPSAERVRFDGPLRAAFLRGEGSALVSALVARAPLLRLLWDARQRSEPVPLNQSTLLRGSGFTQLFLELTGRCNERCLHCYADAGPERAEALEEAVIEQVLDDACQLGFEAVQLTGGDPLLSEHCAAAAKLARSLGLGVEVYTNGLALHERLYLQLREADAHFAFSFYSHDAAVHDAITRTHDSQRRTVRAIERVLRDGLLCRVSVIVLDENHAGLPDTLAYLYGLGLPEARVGIDVQRSVGRGHMTIAPGDTGVKQVTTGERTHSSLATSTLGTLSLAGKIAVSYDGEVMPCIFGRQHSFGNVRRERLRTLLLASAPVQVDRDRVVASMSQPSEQLACWDCRVRAAFLPDTTLVSLRHRSP